MRQRLLDGGGRRDMVPPVVPRRKLNCVTTVLGRGCLSLSRKCACRFQAGPESSPNRYSGPLNSARCSSCNCDPTGSLIVLGKIKVGGLLFSVSRIG